MKVKMINLNKYKRFHSLKIELGENPKKVVALVGPNGCGKSSIFDGMLHLSSFYGNGQIGQNGRRSEEYHSRYTNSKVEATDITVVFDDNISFLEKHQLFQQQSKGNIVFTFRSAYRYSSQLNITQLKSVGDIKDNNSGASSASDIDDKITNNFQAYYAYINKYRKENDLTDRQALESVLGEFNRALISCLDLELFDIGDILDGNGTLFFKKSDQNEKFNFNVLSSGEKEIIDMLLDLSIKKDKYNDSIYIIDEPELHLNTNIQRKLLVEIEKLIPDNCQLWIATHSIGFLRALQEELREKSDIIDFEGNYANEEVILVPMEKTRNNWLKLYKTALDDITGLLAPKTIIYCEGRKELIDGKEVGLDATVLNIIFEYTHPDVLFVSAGGCSEMDKYSSIALNIISKAFDQVNLLVLKDKDIKGKNITTDKERIEFLAKCPSNRMLNRLEIENYLFDYEVIQSKYPEITQESYDRLIIDIRTDDIKKVASELKKLTRDNNKQGFNIEALKVELAKHIKPSMKVYKELEECIFSI